MTKKIHYGIYKKIPAKATEAFLIDSSQQQAESQLMPFYLWETLAHNFMLFKQNIVPEKEAKKILKSLLKYIVDAENGSLISDPKLGDIHENIEARLTDDIKEAAGWMHIARSRNDQVTTDQKLLTKKLFFDLSETLVLLGSTLGEKAEMYKNVVMPGFTHLRVAMPSSFGFWWQAYLDQIVEWEEIIKNLFMVIDKNPLGAGASYGVNWPINTEMTTQDLGFDKPIMNALSAINSRGIHEIYLIGPLCGLATILSRMMEDIIIFSMPEIGYIAIDEGFTSGSSIMPQKINPDIAEKIRSKAGKLLGQFVNTCMVMKGTPSGYNRDSAETKVAIIETMQETISILAITNNMLVNIVSNKENMKAHVIPSLATLLADELVQAYKIPFRQAHQIVGKSLEVCDRDIHKLTHKIIETVFKSITGKSVKFPAGLIEKTINPNTALDRLSYQGTPNPKFVTKTNEKLLADNRRFASWSTAEKKKFYQAKKNLIKKVKEALK